MPNALETGKAILPGLLAKLPENLRATAEAAFSAPEATDALTELGARALAQADYSRLADDITAQKTKLEEQFNELNEWYNTRKEVLAEYDRIKPEYLSLKAAHPDPAKHIVDPAHPLPVGLSKEQIEEILAAREAARDEGYAGVLAVSNRLTAQHYKDFGEVLDLDPCIDTARKQHITLVDAYKIKYADKIKAK